MATRQSGPNLDWPRERGHASNVPRADTMATRRVACAGLGAVGHGHGTRR